MSKRKNARQLLSQLARTSLVENLETRIVLDGDFTLDPDLAAEIYTPGEGEAGEITLDPNLPVGANTPATSTSFDGVNFDQQATTAGFYFIPPDTSGASGPNHIVDVVNCNIEIWTKAGVNQLRQRLGINSSTAVGSFFASLSPTTPLFDPKVVYDTYNNRFVVVALERTDTADGDPSNTSRAFIAVSDDSDPNGTWYTQQINTKTTISGVDTWYDYPGIAVDANAIYLTGNMFGFGASGVFQGSRLWIINKTGLYTGTTGTVNIYDPSTLAALPGQSFTYQPAMMYGTAPGTVGTYLVASGWNSGATEFLSVIRINSPLSSPTFTNTFLSVGDISNGSIPRSPQLGTATTIDGGDIRMQNAVWRNNALWCCNVINPVSGADVSTTTAHWYKIAITTGSATLSDQGNVGAEDLGTNTYTSYPAVTVDTNGNMAMEFTASSTTRYPGAFYTGRLSTDTAGTVQATATLQAGLDYYNRSFGSGNVRWGDYAGISVDPSDNTTFWMFGEYAMARGTVFSGEDGRWATRWGKFSFTSTGTVVGTLYEDRNGDSTFNGTDAGITGIIAWVDYDNNGSLNGSEPSGTSIAGGGYTISNVTAGTWTVRSNPITNYIRLEGSSGQAGTVVPASGSVTRNFGYFPTVFTGTASNDSYYIRASGANTQIWVGAVPPTTATYSIAKSLLTSLTFNAGAGDDSMVVDYSLGDPIPTSGVAFNGQTNTVGDTLDVRSTGLGDTLSISAAGSIVHGSTTVTYGTIETLNTSANTLNVSANLAGLNLNASGATTAVNFTTTETLGLLNVTSNAQVNSASTTIAALAIDASNIILASGKLNIVANGTMKGVTKTKALSITGTGFLNLHDNDLIVDYTGGPSPAPTIRSYITTGLTLLGGAGTTGIGSTEVDSQTPNGVMLGIVDNGDVGGAITTLSGAAPTAQSVLVKYTWFGDCDLSGSVNGSDYALVDSGFTSGGSLTGWVFGNFDYSSLVDGSDYALIDTGFITQNTVL